MSETFVLSGLVRKRAELAGEVEALRTRVAYPSPASCRARWAARRTSARNRREHSTMARLSSQLPFARSRAATASRRASASA